jgi:hypothetical protein
MIHRETTFCGHRATERGGTTIFWVGACDCGWQGAEHDTSGSQGADGAHREYREHVEAELGAEAYYDADVACRNCGSHHRQGVLVGTHCMSNVCSRCGTTMLEPDNDVWEADRARDGLWGGWPR